MRGKSQTRRYSPVAIIPILMAAVVFISIFSVNVAGIHPCPTCPPCTNCPPVTNSFNVPAYSAIGPKLTIPVLTSTNFYTSMFDHDASLAWDVYFRTNLNLTNWTILAAGTVGNTNYWIANTNTTDRFLIAGSGLDADGDGMPDGWELLHGLNPYSAADAAQDADGDGLSNLEEFRRGTEPQGAEAFTVTVSTPRNFLPLP